MNHSNQITIIPPFNYTKNSKTMESNQFFSTDRFKHLLSRELAQNKRIGLIVLATLFLVLFTNALTWAYQREMGFHKFGYPLFLIVSGSILTSLSFSEMDKSYGKQFYLLLPASNFEKFLSKWLLTGVGFFSVFTLGYFIFAYVVRIFGNAFFDFDLGTFEFFNKENRLFIQVFFALNALFLLGATYFRKFAVFKTVLSTFLTVVCMAMIGVLLFRLVMFDLFDGLYQFNPFLEINDKMVPVEPSGSQVRFMQKNGENYIRLWGLWIIPAVLLVVGYFKLKETEL